MHIALKEAGLLKDSQERRKKKKFYANSSNGIEFNMQQT